MGLACPGLQTKIMTNGILLEDRIEPLAALDDLLASVALNAADAETYRRLHRTDHFEKVLRGLRRLKEARRDKATRLDIKFLLTRSTRRQIPDFARLAVDLGVDQVGYRPLRFYAATDIDPHEKIEAGSPAQAESDRLLEEARQILEAAGITFGFIGWETKADQYAEARHDDADVSD
jgi:MoaA/NifB/PqqE/SkfB family radical SAM enzyme